MNDNPSYCTGQRLDKVQNVPPQKLTVNRKSSDAVKHAVKKNAAKFTIWVNFDQERYQPTTTEIEVALIFRGFSFFLRI